MFTIFSYFNILEINQAFRSAAHKILLCSEEEMKIDRFYFGTLDSSSTNLAGRVFF